MFELAKIVGWLLSPLTMVLGLWVLALLAFRSRRAALALGAGLLGLLGLWTLSMPMVAHTFSHHLETRFPALPVDEIAAGDALVVLGGAVSVARPPLRPHFDLGSAADRVWHAADLYRAGKARWVLVSGGSHSPDPAIAVEAEAMRSMLLTLGVPDSAIRLEGVSRNTVENARHSLALIRAVDARRVLLVTSALHMPRALATFRAALRGTDVTVAPASTDVEALPDTLHPVARWLPEVNALAMSTRALREYLGLAADSLGSALWE